MSRWQSAILVVVLFASSVVGADTNGPSAGSPDGKRNAVGDGDALRIFDVATGKEIISIKAHTGKVTAVAFSPDGKQLVSGGEDKTVRVFEAATGKALMTLKGHAAAIVLIGFTPDGKVLATVDKDEKRIQWETATGRQLP